MVSIWGSRKSRFHIDNGSWLSASYSQHSHAAAASVVWAAYELLETCWGDGGAARVFFSVSRSVSTLAPFSCMRLLCICRAQEKNSRAAADQVHVRECFFLRAKQGDVIASHMQNTIGQPFYFLCARKNCARAWEMHLHARPRKNSLFCISPWESNWNNYFLRADERTLGKNLNPSGKKISAMGDFFRAMHNNRRSFATMCFGNWTFHCLTRGYHVYIPVFFANPPPINTSQKNLWSRCRARYNGIIASAHTHAERAKTMSSEQKTHPNCVFSYPRVIKFTAFFCPSGDQTYRMRVGHGCWRLNVAYIYEGEKSFSWRTCKKLKHAVTLFWINY
jgi:hypothetical protein